MINEEEKKIASFCVSKALECGSSAVRVSLSKSTMDSLTYVNGELDRTSHSDDRSVFLYLFVEGRFGTFSTNKLDIKDLSSFIDGAVETVRMLAPDACRKLPELSRTAFGLALSGNELGLYDQKYESMDLDLRLQLVEKACVYSHCPLPEGFTLISEECEWSDSLDDNYLLDSNGFEGRHIETSFGMSSSVTLSDVDGRKYSGFWWKASPTYDTLSDENCSEEAVRRAVLKKDAQAPGSFHGKMVVENSISSRLLSQLLNALNGASIQQKASFLQDCKGKKIFPDCLSLWDRPHQYGKAGSRMFDTEGVATKDLPLIDKGVVSNYFLNTYIAGKLGMDATVEGVSKPVLTPFPVKTLENKLSLQDVLEFCGEGVLVTDFNGGNCNPATGDFSYGIEGFLFEAGKLTKPLHEMLITGNVIDLWSRIIAIGTDGRDSARWAVPTLAFRDVDFT